MLKWHCYLTFADDVDDRPPSILITTLAGHAYRGQHSLGTALIEVVERMPVKAAANWANETAQLREARKLTVSAGVGALGVGAGRRSPHHTFFGREAT